MRSTKAISAIKAQFNNTHLEEYNDINDHPVWGHDVDNQRTSVWGDLKDIGAKAGLAASFIALATGGVQAFVASSIEPYQNAIEAIVLNLPMVASATILAMLVLRNAYAHSNFWPAVATILAAIVVPYVLAWLLGFAPGLNRLSKIYADCVESNPFCDGPILERNPGFLDLIQFVHPATAASLAYDILSYYVSDRMLTSTVSATIAGIFLAWVFEFKLLRRIRSSSPLA